MKNYTNDLSSNINFKTTEIADFPSMVGKKFNTEEAEDSEVN
jgi:hypothetical protein